MCYDSRNITYLTVILGMWLDEAMLRLCTSCAAAVRGSEWAALEADMGLMNVDAEDMEAVSGRREDITATEKRKFCRCVKQVQYRKNEALSCACYRGNDEGGL